jgi:pyruvate/2-oxoglutarate dehydrogenase complex dihydrolipoamide acyltransferase (E2) component
MADLEVKVPDIGDFKDVEVIEVLVKPGDRIAAEQSLVTVESDKASMEIPSSAAGVVKEMKVKVGDKVNEGSLLLTLEAADGARPVESSDDKGVLVAPGVAASRPPSELVQPQTPSGAAPAAAPAAPPAPAAATPPATPGGSVQVTVPDIGDFAEVAVIEVLV